ncbi:Crp/Fnr family transcriptional regulator [Sphaerotilus microaerophilus]|jgi:CRP-like cAMP-binding protein|uniref:HTH crp-type domain-containing protein n=1 Tax=Sphaerotilus microaerophilus TaxID=2914710 RepID=A0ABM7YSP3_9BURK|nr:Crp/Fnr family transcriptional regulator [Sphaerotilus sp. FB-5]BDI07634.1 hypothetical protein CATMQ487_46040 [Sphaerotilus sp. FB-5]
MQPFAFPAAAAEARSGLRAMACLPLAQPPATTVGTGGRRNAQGEADIALLRRAFDPAEPAEVSLDTLRTNSLVVRHPIGPLQLSSPAAPVPAWWLLRRGRIALGWQTEQDLFAEKRLIGPGEWLDVAGAMAAPAAWIEAAQCRTPVELLAVPVSALHQACAQDLALMQAVGRLLATRVRSLSDTLHDVVTADVPARLARWLLRRLEARGNDQPLRLVLTELKQSIAAQLGTTSETFSRALRKLSDAGIVQVEGYALTVLDVDALGCIAWPSVGSVSARQSFSARRRVGASPG